MSIENRYATIELKGIKKLYQIGGEEVAALAGISSFQLKPVSWCDVDTR